MSQPAFTDPAGNLQSALDQALAREAAMREILGVISQNPEDVQPVLEVIVRNAARLCETPDVGLHMVNDARTQIRLACISEASADVFPVGHDFDLGAPYQTALAIREARVIHNPDIADDPLYRAGDPVRVRLVEVDGVRSRLSVPLLKNGVAFGCINVNRHEVRPFTADEIGLIESFAAQAVIAIENASQFRELQARLEREVATRDILEVISQSRDNDAPVFDVILRNAARLCNAPMAWLMLANEARTEVMLAGYHGLTRQSLKLGDTWELFTEPGMLTEFGRAIVEARTTQDADLALTPQYLNGEASVRQLVDEEGLRSRMSVPLVSRGKGIGAIILSRREVAPFGPEDIALIDTFAEQAVIAIENVRQFRELQDRLEREEATRQILQVINQSRNDETPVFDAILERAERLCEALSSALLLVDATRSNLVLVATRGMRSSSDIGEIHPITSGHTSSDAVLTGAIVHVHDVRDTELYRNGDPLRIEMVDRWGLRTSLAVPLISNGMTIGAITVMRLHIVSPFSANDISLLEAFAAQAVIAIENARQFKALEALNAELGARVRQQVDEIERMGRLKRFLPAAVADAVISSGSENMLKSHRALLGVLFCDIRGFTAFCETAEPEETIEVLQTYHTEMGKLIAAHGAGVDHRMGDGIMVLFNDPLPCDDPAGRAVRLGLAMRDRMADLCEGWKKMGHRLGFGVGISLGYATVGMVGAGGRTDYTASGTAINLASRLSDAALDGEILLSPRARLAVEGAFDIHPHSTITLKGIGRPVEVFCVIGPVTA